MSNLEKNKNIIETLKTSSELFKDLQINDNKLFFKGLTIDLNNIDLESIINDMSEITPDNLFHALERINSKKDNKANWELVKKENPDMKNITIFDNHNMELNKDEEFISIRTSDGKNHLFKNVIGLDIFNEYMQLKAIYGDNISPEILAKSIERWQLNELAITPAENVITNPNINENIKNQIQTYLDMYKDNQNIEITVNVAEDIIYINNKLNPDKNRIITFTKDINNRLVGVEHQNNVSSETTKPDDNPETTKEETQPEKDLNTISDSVSGANNLKYDNTQTILSDAEFAYIISKGNISSTDYQRINKYLTNTQEMMKNNDPNVENNMKNIEESITSLQLLKDNPSPEEQALIDKCNEVLEEHSKSTGLDKGQALTYKTENRILLGEEEDNSAGYLNIISIFITVSVILIGLSILVLHFLK